MSRFVMRVSDDFKEECHSAMLHDNMNISSGHGSCSTSGQDKG